MLNAFYSSRFKKDFRACVKRGYDISLLEAVIDILRIPDKLPEFYLDHQLSGSYSGYRECHIKPDWLLIYRRDTSELYLARTGTHAELFGN